MSECSTPLVASKMDPTDLYEQPYAVKIVRDDDQEKIIAHQREFEILSKLKHPNVVGAIELFTNEFKHEVF